MSYHVIGYAGLYTIGAPAPRAPKRDPVMNTIFYANKWARYFNVPISWIVTLAHLESSHNPKRVNMARADKGGAWGLVQQMADEAQYKIDTIKRGYKAYKPVMDVIKKKWKGKPENLLDPDLNVIISAWQLGRLRKEFGDDFEKVAAAYHQGAGAVRERLEEGKPAVSPKLQPKGYHYVKEALATQQSYGPQLLATHIPSLDVAVEGEYGVESPRHI